MPVKEYAQIEPATHKTCSLDAKLFLEIKKSPIFDHSISKKRNVQNE